MIFVKQNYVKKVIKILIFYEGIIIELLAWHKKRV